jgi:hypothetical protein
MSVKSPDLKVLDMAYRTDSLLVHLKLRKGPEYRLCLFKTYSPVINPFFSLLFGKVKVFKGKNDLDKFYKIFKRKLLEDEKAVL